MEKLYTVERSTFTEYTNSEGKKYIKDEKNPTIITKDKDVIEKVKKDTGIYVERPIYVVSKEDMNDLEYITAYQYEIIFDNIDRNKPIRSVSKVIKDKYYIQKDEVYNPKKVDIVKNLAASDFESSVVQVLVSKYHNEKTDHIINTIVDMYNKKENSTGLETLYEVIKEYNTNKGE